MAQEFKVTVDTSLKAENNPKALEKKMNEMSREGWSLTHITSFTDASGSDNIVITSRIYLFWQGDALEGQIKELADGPASSDKRIFR